MYRIALIEDDVPLCEMIAEMLVKYGFEVSKNFNYRNLSKEILAIQPHLVLLDINLPYFDGYHIARELRQTSRVPIIMISARGTEAEQIRGFDFGADDYVVKPFSMEMLKVKINACLRRVYSETANQPECLMVGELKLDPKNFMMYYHDKSMELTKNELKIMMVLAENPREIVKRERLLSELWDDMTFVEDNTLTVNISRIKTKLIQLGLKDAIRTKRGEGYLLCYKEDKNEAT